MRTAEFTKLGPISAAEAVRITLAERAGDAIDVTNDLERWNSDHDRFDVSVMHPTGGRLTFGWGLRDYQARWMAKDLQDVISAWAKYEGEGS